MSYSSLNDAFNINSNFENTIRGLNTFNPINNTMENIKSSHDLNESNYFRNSNNNSNTLNNFDRFTNSDISYEIDGIYANNDNISYESLNGTDLFSYVNKNDDSKNNLKTNSKTYSNTELNTDLNSNKLTHRKCINIYNNPDYYKDSTLSQALKHVSKCTMCKNEIKNSFENNDKINEIKKYKNNDLSTDSNLKNSKIENKIENNTENHKLINNNDNYIIESELRLLRNKINEESNLKYQNSLINNNISKYLEDLEERKKINYKLDRIIEIINTNSYFKNNSKIDTDLNSNIEYKKLLELFSSPQLYTNLSKLNNLDNNFQINNSNSNSTNITSFETYIFYTAIIIIIILLIVDIIIRLNYSTNK